MTSFFDILGLPLGLSLSPAAIEQATREAARDCHPDSGGNPRDFAAIQQAGECLASPAGRLQHWLECHDIPIEGRGSLPSDLMDTFGRIGPILQRSDACARRRAAARSTLALALTEREALACREEIEIAITAIDSRIRALCEVFPELEANPSSNAPRSQELLRSLRFLEKWRASLRAAFARLI